MKPHEFMPVRWLQGKDESKKRSEERMRKFREVDMVFGGGNRICLGKPLALVEVYKVVATVCGKVAEYML